MMINPSDLKYFIEVAKTQHMSRAAERLGVTQPTLSHCLKRMERELGHELLIRTQKGVVLTSSGQKLLEQAQEMLQQWERLLAAVNEDVEEVTGLIKVGCHTAVAQYTLPFFLPEFLREHPKVEVRIEHGLSRHMAEQVVSRRLDVAFVVNPVAHPDLIIKELTRDQVTLWKSHHCQNADVLLIEPNLTQTQKLIDLLAKQGRSFKRTIESSSLEVLCQLAIAGTGVAILPERVMRAIGASRLERVKGAPSVEDRICLVYRRDFIKLQRGKVFTSLLIERLKARS